MRTAKAVGKAVTLSMHTLVNLFKKIREIAGDIPGYLKMVDGFVDDLIKSFKSNIDILFKKYQAVINLLNDLGVIVTRNIDQNLFPELVAQGLDGQVYVIRNKTPIFNGTDEAFDAFAKKIDEINDGAGGGKKGKKAVDEYLDEVELYTNITGKPIDLNLLKKLQAEFKSIGGELIYDQESFNYIKAREKALKTKIEAISIGEDLIMLGEDVSKSGVYEELIHARQNRTGRLSNAIREYGFETAINLMELEAAEELIKLSKQLKIDKNEVFQIKLRVKQFKQILKKLKYER